MTRIDFCATTYENTNLHFDPNQLFFLVQIGLKTLVAPSTKTTSYPIVGLKINIYI